MTDNLVISLDAMGGDDAPRIVVDGADLARKKYPQAKFLLFGDEIAIKPLLDKRPALKAVASVRHTPDRVTNDEKPGIALRTGRNSSMRLAINAVADGEAHCVVSAGNTGALMAMAKFSLKVLPGITRPAIAAYFPTLKAGHGTVMLDLGANLECDAKILNEFAVLGAVFSREILKIDEPRIGLLNVGSEEMKGNDSIREAAELLGREKLPGRFIGFVEGNDATKGTVDVVVTDGFTGNVSLKTMEGTAKLVSHMIKTSFKSSILSWIGLVFMLPAIMHLKKRMDPRNYNGGMFMGLKGICVKSHGGTDAVGFANAIGVAADMALIRFNEKVESALLSLSASHCDQTKGTV